MSYDLKKIIDQFPALTQLVDGKPLVYLDSAATTLKPRLVIEGLSEFYLMNSANVHRGAHFLSDLATEKVEDSRKKVASFIGATNTDEIVFTSGTTDSINLVASSFTAGLSEGDEILLTEMEHHSNLVPWQMAAERKKLRIKFIRLNDKGELDLSNLDEILTKKTKIVAMVHCSNALGTVNPVKEIIKKAKSVGAKTLVDGAQAVSAFAVDVKDLKCDFYVFSGHKLFGPTGIGVLFGKKELLNSMPPYRGGGSMIGEVSLEGSTFLASPQRFEAGTPHIAGIYGLGLAIDFICDLGLESVQEYESSLFNYAIDELNKVEGLKFFGRAKERVNILSFNLEGAHPSDVGSIMDKQGVAVRAGHHCCQPIMKSLDILGTVRASLSLYSCESDIESLVNAVKKAKEFF